METGHFETPKWHHDKALRALQVAKEIEAKKRAQGARYERTNSKTWILRNE